MQVDNSIDYEKRKAVQEGRKVTLVGMLVNIALAVLKVFAGIFGRSIAMLADGIHSVSDLITDAAVIVVVGVSRRKDDDIYTYGHGKIETLTSLIISVLLAMVGLGLMAEGYVGVVNFLNGEIAPRPEWYALAMAVLSIASKEWLYRYTKRTARKIGSTAMEANAWHHRSDAFSSLATFIGIFGAMFFGAKWRVLDPLAAILVSVLILLMGWKLAVASVKELLETSLPKDITENIMKMVAETPGVLAYHRFRSRRNGSRMIIEFHIKVNPMLTVVEGHDIATNIEHKIKQAYGDVLVTVHVEPYLK